MGDDIGLPVDLVDEQDLPIDRERLAAVAVRTAAAEGALGQLSILLVGAARMAELNRRHLGGHGATDVLAFPIDGLVAEPAGEDAPPVVIGEVVLCPEVAAAQAKDGLDEELDLLVAHGVLHLLGHDHDTEEAAALMRERERAATGRSGASAS